MAVNYLYLLVPFAFFSLGYVWHGHQAALMLFAPAVMASAIRDRVVRWLVWYVTAWAVVWRVAFVFGIVSGQMMTRGFLSQMLLCGSVAVYLACARSTIPAGRFYNTICIAALIQSALGIAQWAGFDVCALHPMLRSNYSGPQVVGTLGNSNFLAAFLAMSLPFFLRWRWLYAAVLPFAVLVCAKSSAGVICAAVALCVYFGSWRLLAGMIVICAAYVTFDWREMSLFKRMEWSRNLLQLSFSDPLKLLVGHGPAAETGFRHPIHNDWVEMLYRFGLGSIYLAIAYLINLRGKNRMLAASLAAFFVNGLVSYPFRLAPLVFLAAMCMGLIERESNG